MKKNIIYFSNHLTISKGHGISRYSNSLLSNLIYLNDHFKIIPVTASNRLNKSELLKLKNTIGLKILKTGRFLTPTLWWVFKKPSIENLLNLKEISLVHTLSLGYPVITKKPLVVTIHDIGPLIEPNFFTRKDKFLMKKSFKQCVDSANKIICVSEATADRVENYSKNVYGSKIGNRINVIHEGVSESFFHKDPQDNLSEISNLNFDIPYILLVGQLSPRKNIEIVFKAFAKLKNKFPDFMIYIVGGNGWDYNNIYKLVNKLNIESQVIFLGFVSDLELRLLYKNAKVFIFPSLFEGFGLPILEAMACKCPVICSDIPSLREISKGFAIYFKPNSLIELVSKVEYVLNGKFQRDSFVDSAYHNSKQFTWKETARKTAIIYDEFS